MKKIKFCLKGLLIFTFVIVSKSLLAQCSTNPASYNAVVSGAFSYGGYTGRTSVLMLRGSDPLSRVQHGILDLYKSNDGFYPAIWDLSGFDVSKVNGRMVSGEFMQSPMGPHYDDMISSAAAFYDNGDGSTTIKKWTVDGPNSVAFTSNAWTSSPETTFDASKITGRIVNGDFDEDGILDDIAALYDCGNGVTKIYVWRKNMQDATFWVEEWWDSTPLGGYSCDYISNRVVAGDFDHDDVIDDIAVLYDYGNGAMRIHVFTSNAPTELSFTYQGAGGWWSTASGYTPSNINGRIVCGNFDKSGLINHKNDDIVALYDYGNGNVKAHVWASNGSSFSYYWKWETSGFWASNVTNRLTSFQGCDYDNPEKCFDMAGLYNYGSNTDKYYIWSNTGSWNFASTWDYFCSKSPISNYTNTFIDMEEKDEFLIYPNPSDGNFTIEFESENPMEIVIMNSMGSEVHRCKISDSKTDINLSGLTPGLYFVNAVTSDGHSCMKKLIIQ